MAKRGIPKREWSQFELNFLRANWHKMNNKQLAKMMGCCLTHVRSCCYELGLKRMELEYWTEEQITFLREHYKTIGDVELAEIFNELWVKKKTWTKKHIEKKRMYLKLKRTEEEKVVIKERNRLDGRFSVNHWRRWSERTTPVGETRMWKNGQTGRAFMVIKTESGFVHYARWLYNHHYGEIPEKYMVRLIDNDPYNVTIDNLELVTMEENAKRNASISSTALSDKYIAGILTHGNPELRADLLDYPELLDVKRKQLQLNRVINESKNRGAGKAHGK